MRRIPTLALLLTLLGAAGCADGPDGSGREVRLLLDGRHAPDVLVEQQRIDLPTSPHGNRFLSGWHPWLLDTPRGHRLILAPGGRARIEVVHLGKEPRTLSLELLLAEPLPQGRQVRARAAGRDLGAFPLANPLEIPLPGDLPSGRVQVDLDFEPGARGVMAAAVRPVLPAGKAQIEGEDLIQEGDSLVDLVHRVPAGATLVGAFEPPSTVQEGQRFDLTVEREDGTPAGRFSWSPGAWGRLRGARKIEIPLGEAEGFVRVRLRASGRGPAGRWEGLGLSAPKGEEPPGEAAPVLAAGDASSAPRLVVVYVMDALRADAVGHLGGLQGVSAVLDRLAREGVTFRHHRSVAPNTLPSTKALFTGRTLVAGGDDPLPPELGAPLPELFREAGYRTGLFSGNIHVSSPFHLDRGFEHVAGEVLLDEEKGSHGGSYNDNATRVQAAALEWLRSIPRGERAFLYLHTIHPHNPYDPPEPFRSRYTRGIPSEIDGATETLLAARDEERALSPADRQRLRGLYAGAFSFNDAELQGFLAGLAGWAPPEETLVVVTSDHGEELFEHGGLLHGYTLYDEMMDIPLVAWSPGRLEPAVVEEPTDTLDLHATLLALCGLKAPGKAEGRPLTRAPRGDSDYVHFAAASSRGASIFSARRGRWKLIWAPRFSFQWGMGDGLGRSRDPEYLFDLESDPGEKVNLAGEGGLEAAWLRSRLFAWMARDPDLARESSGPKIDAETARKLRALGYAH